MIDGHLLNVKEDSHTKYVPINFGLFSYILLIDTMKLCFYFK